MQDATRIWFVAATLKMKLLHFIILPLKISDLFSIYPVLWVKVVSIFHIVTNSEKGLWRPTNLVLDRKRQLAGDIECMKKFETSTKNIDTNKHSTPNGEGYDKEESTSDKENNYCFQLSQKRPKLNKCSDETRPSVLLQNQAHVTPDKLELRRKQVEKQSSFLMKSITMNQNMELKHFVGF